MCYLGVRICSFFLKKKKVQCFLITASLNAASLHFAEDEIFWPGTRSLFFLLLDYAQTGLNMRWIGTRNCTGLDCKLLLSGHWKSSVSMEDLAVPSVKYMEIAEQSLARNLGRPWIQSWWLCGGLDGFSKVGCCKLPRKCSLWTYSANGGLSAKLCRVALPLCGRRCKFVSEMDA